MRQTAQAFNEQSVEEICQHCITEASLTRDVSRLNCYTIPNLRPTTSAPEANVEFHDIVAAVSESQMNAMIPDVMQCSPSTLSLLHQLLHQLNAASVTCGASRARASAATVTVLRRYLRNTVAAEARLTDAALRLPRDCGQPEH